LQESKSFTEIALGIEVMIRRNMSNQLLLKVRQASTDFINQFSPCFYLFLSFDYHIMLFVCVVYFHIVRLGFMTHSLSYFASDKDSNLLLIQLLSGAKKIMEKQMIVLRGIEEVLDEILLRSHLRVQQLKIQVKNFKINKFNGAYQNQQKRWVNFFYPRVKVALPAGKPLFFYPHLIAPVNFCG